MTIDHSLVQMHPICVLHVIHLPVDHVIYTDLVALESAVKLSTTIKAWANSCISLASYVRIVSIHGHLPAESRLAGFYQRHV